MALKNENPIYHWTIYKNKKFDMYCLDGSISVNCIVFHGDEFQCSRVIAAVGGVRKFRCLTAVTAQEIIDATKKGLDHEGNSANSTDS
ncbi:hypothetical protein HBI56_090480 [Parastagonospora nodorum]|uniref:Uncharacterized protein n=2 Tax=Phaeosphaeria nodorum (strain SN15 / ATCC MYA-4574 / FGSC 10173) TaxID=321614 RepID=A0A7U2FDG5_PHANO|nr:hypothetical protein SNOG_10010 [Parastagonospora nodorum SN15]KAH3912902.1 hypothetical protein HBH56_109000 [Parastagonospora nodorum]EAT82345.1 hypothetical protein SNOG_10010 [Parastagonospora nodorum SN15]KAH3922275.1 hypothetical protein HBH54_226100 [Parastagonospora nodorum]KAH3951049.1 hypothetical protein HBH53_064740 [Parastagonospora nodorum]KAH3974456.1 hypothetical protein HBH51_093540 [Parastagonospora nodorum]